MKKIQIAKIQIVMNTLDAIKARKSTRSYTAQPVEKEKLEQIVAAGNQAAIAGKLDFVVITNASVIDAIQKTAKGDNDFTPFSNLFNDFYAKDTSKKVRAIKRAQELRANKRRPTKAERQGLFSASTSP